MIQTNNEQYVTKKSDSKDHALTLVNSKSDFINELSSNQKIIDSDCYVCSYDKPQFTGSLVDGRVVDYCGECFVIVNQLKEIKN